MTKFIIDGEAVRKLAEILVETDLSEIEYEDNGSKIRVARNLAAVTNYVQPGPTVSQNVSVSADVPQSTAKDNANHPGALKSPMVGTAYLAPEPGANHYAKVGDTVTAGQTLLIIEAMKVMNPIKAPQSGTVTKILVNDTMPVEFGELLMIIE